MSDDLEGRPDVELEVVGDRTEGSRCDEGFLQLRRLTLRHRWSDGELSAEYAYDVVERAALDAVAMVLVTDPRVGPVRIALRSAIRPPLAFRPGYSVPLEEPPGAVLWEVPAGLVEPDERGEAGLQGCAARETLEEVGLTLAPEAFSRLGPAAYISPGVLAEKLHYFIAVVNPLERGRPTEDGSPVEERAETRFVELGEALAACRDGRVQDLKTETGIRRAIDWTAA